jgi:hypothetical protein
MIIFNKKNIFHHEKKEIMFSIYNTLLQFMFSIPIKSQSSMGLGNMTNMIYKKYIMGYDAIEEIM